MRRNALKGFRYITRWILLIGVITGIFFSSGEGIQLLPFPISPDNSEKGSFFLQAERGKSYTLSIRNFAHSLSIKSKIQKNVKDLACSDLCANEFDVNRFFSFALKQNHLEIGFFYAYRFFNLSSSRAPPIV